MGFKSILTILSDERQLPQLEAAAALAIRENGHLSVLSLGLDLTQVGYYFPDVAPYAFADAIDVARDQAAALNDRVRQRLAGMGDLRWSAEGAVAQIGAMGSLVGARARFSDLTVTMRPYGPEAPGDAEAVIEAALFDGGCPVLVLPGHALPADPPAKVLVAWNQSLESLAAARRALPFLQAASRVEIAIVDPRRDTGGSEPGAALAQLLTRHGATVEIAVLARTADTTSDQLNRRATEIGADLVVMGAYGHSRLREAILGGTTRNMLEKARVPVFMAR